MAKTDKAHIRDKSVIHTRITFYQMETLNITFTSLKRWNSTVRQNILSQKDQMHHYITSRDSLRQKFRKTSD